MPWTEPQDAQSSETARREYQRTCPRYASDLTDWEWVLIEPFMPPPKPLGRPRTANLREVVNAILSIAMTGCQWAMLPRDLPPPSTVQRFKALQLQLARRRAAPDDPLHLRHGDPRTGGPGGAADRGIRDYDAGKKVKGRKRYIVTDALGLVVGRVVHGAAVQDRDGDAANWPRTGRHPSPQPSRGSTSPTSASQPDASRGIAMFDRVSKRH